LNHVLAKSLPKEDVRFEMCKSEDGVKKGAEFVSGGGGGVFVD